MPLKMTLLSNSTDDKKVWNSFVFSSPNGTIYHTSYWLDAWQGNYEIWCLYKGNEIMAGFVAPYKNIMGMKIIVPPTFTPYSGILFKDYEGKYVSKISAQKDMCREFAILIKSRFNRGILPLHNTVIDMQAFMWENFRVNLSYTYILTISDINELFGEMNSDTRNAIRKAQKDQLFVQEAESFNDIINLVQKTYQRQNLSHSFSSAGKIYNELMKRDLCRGFICLDSDGNKIATYCIIWDERRAYGFLSGYDSQNKHKGATSICVWEAIKFISTNLKFKEFDLEGSMIPRIERFNRGFGGRIIPVYGIRWGKGLNSMLNLRNYIYKYFKI